MKTYHYLIFILSIVLVFILGRSGRVIEYKDVKEIEVCSESYETQRIRSATEVCGDAGVKTLYFEEAGPMNETKPRVECKEKK